VVHIKVAQKRPNNIQMITSDSEVYALPSSMIDQEMDEGTGTNTFPSGMGTDDTNSNHVTFGNYLDDEYKIGDDEFVVEDDDDDLQTPGTNTLNNDRQILLNGVEDYEDIDEILIEASEDDEVVNEINSEFMRITPGIQMDATPQ